jgi:hypothetical protein
MDNRTSALNHSPFFRLLVISGVACLLLACTNAESQDPEFETITGVLQRFILQSYGPDGDLAEAYDLLSSETRQSCTRSEFVRLAMVGRQIIRGRDLKVDRFRDLEVVDNTATLSVRVRMGKYAPPSYPKMRPW